MKVTKNKDRDEGAAVAAYSIPEAGAMVGLSRNGSYDAARRNEIPVLQFGRRKIGIADPRRLRTDSDLLEKAAQTFSGFSRRGNCHNFAIGFFSRAPMTALRLMGDTGGELRSKINGPSSWWWTGGRGCLASPRVPVTSSV